MSTVMQLHAATTPAPAGNVINLFGARQRPQSKADGVFAQINCAARDMGVKPHLAHQYARQAKKDYLAGNRTAERVVADWTAALRRITQQVRA